MSADKVPVSEVLEIMKSSSVLRMQDVLALARRADPDCTVESVDAALEILVSRGDVLRTRSTSHQRYYRLNGRQKIGRFTIGDRVSYTSAPGGCVVKTGQIIDEFRGKAVVYDGGHNGADNVLIARLHTAGAYVYLPNGGVRWTDEP